MGRDKPQSAIVREINWSAAAGRTGISWLRLSGLFVLFFLIAWGLGYPTLSRYDPSRTPGLKDAQSYAALVTGAPVTGLEHLRYRVLVSWIARPFYHLARGRAEGWDPVNFGLLIANSLFVAGTALLMVALGHGGIGYVVSLLASFLYLVNFAVPNLRLAGLVDAGEGFFLLILLWSLWEQRFWMVPFISVLGTLTKESFIPFSVVFTASWWLVARKKLESPRPAAIWIACGWVAGFAALMGVHWYVSGTVENPLQFAETLQGNHSYLYQFASEVWDRNSLYIFVWLLPLGIPRLGRFPRAWLVPSAAASAMAFALDAYHTGAYGTVARALFSIDGPLLAMSAASFLAGLNFEQPVGDETMER
jgi:hypothetical protein